MNPVNKFNNMLLISSEWSSVKSFRLMPIANECPYVEGIYDPTTNTLVMVSKNEKEMFHMMPKLNDDGDYQKSKGRRPGGKDYKEERKTLSTFQEYYITDKQEIENFIQLVALNDTSFDYKKYTENKAEAAPVSVAS